MSQLIPPIEHRTTKQLLKIAGSPEDWTETAVIQAQKELKLRNISEDRIQHARYLSQKRIAFEKLEKGKESYSIFDFVLRPLATLCEIIISWELRKDGFERKANQQQWLRPIFILVILTLIIVLS